ncbi:MAG TPA: sugar phosphate isomerase/epimerase [Longimicrobiales bacterium]
MDRRHFLSGLPLAALAALPVLRAPASALQTGVRARKLGPLGIQLYTLRELAARDLDAALRAIAAAGYQEVELLGFTRNYGHSPAEVRAMLDAHGLKAPSTHVDAGYISADLERHIESAKTMGHQYLVVASFAPDEHETLDDYKAWADVFNRVGDTLRKHGMWLSFHNHADDFKVLDGQVPYDVFMQRTDPALVRHEFDIGNLVEAGRDPMDYLRRFGSRYWLFHVKDPVKAGAAGDTVVGHGIMDWKQFFAAVERPQEKHFFVEQEQLGPDAQADIRGSREYLQNLEY